jgi:signal peptidase I
MSRTDFDAGDLVLIREVDPSVLQPGDIITYQSQNSHNFGENVTHKIRSLVTTEDGNPGFITYGTTTDTNDETVVTYPFVLGKYESRIPGVGTFFNFLKSPLGYFLCIFLPFMLIIVHEGLRFFRLLRSYKEAQNQSIREERERLEQERQANEALLQQLQELKKQLEEEKADA